MLIRLDRRLHTMENYQKLEKIGEGGCLQAILYFV